MIRITEKGVFSLLIAAGAAVLLYVMAGMRDDVVLVPRMVAVLLLILAGFQALMDMVPPVGRVLSFLEGQDDPMGEGGGDTDGQGEDTLGSRIRFFGWIVGLVALIYLSSMLIAITVGLFVYLKWINGESWKLSACYTLGTAAFTYVIFVMIFKLHYFV